MIRPLLGATLTLAAITMAGAVSIADSPTPSAYVQLHESEDLSDAPYSEPVWSIVVHHSAGPVCYADDRATYGTPYASNRFDIDNRQLYVDCAAYLAAGGHIYPKGK